MANFEITPKELMFNANGGTAQISLSVIDYDKIKTGWWVKGKHLWCEYTFEDDLAEETLLYVTAYPNTETTERTDEFIIFFEDDEAGRIIITQGGKSALDDDDDDEPEETITRTYITGFTNDRLITRDVFNKQLKEGHFIDELNKIITYGEVYKISWSSNTVGYTIMVNPIRHEKSKDDEESYCIRCEDIYRRNTLFEKKYYYIFTFGPVTVSNKNGISKYSEKWYLDSDGKYKCDCDIKFVAYNEYDVIIKEMILPVKFEGLASANSEWLYDITGNIAVDSIMFETVESNLCTVCRLKPYDYVVEISSSAEHVIENKLEYYNARWDNISLELNEKI